MFKKIAPLLWAIALFLSSGSPVTSHTNSIGYVGEGSGTVVFWYGSWHSNTTFNEGSLQLVGSNGTAYNAVVTPFNLFSSTLPTGLTAGTNHFQSNGTALVPYGTVQTVSYVYQGVRFTNLQPGTYTFTYIPLGHALSYDPTGTPTLDWQPADNVILSSDVTLTSAIISPPGTAPTLPSYSGPGLAYTVASLVSSAYDQYNAYQHRLASLMLGLTSYQCDTFGEHGVCTSVAAKSSTTVGDGSDFAGIVTVAWRPINHVIVGAFIEQSTTNPTIGSVQFRSHEPTVGAYATLQENTNQTGAKLRLAYARSSDSLRITRAAIGTAEAGTGLTSMSTSGYGAELSYGIELIEGWVATPYVGAWNISTERRGYTETNVSYPITHGDATLDTTTITYGARLSGSPIENITTTFGIGFESDVSSKQSTATGTSNILGAENFSVTLPSINGSTRAVVSASVAYDLGSNQSLGATAVLRHTPQVEGYMQQDNTNVIALVKYSVGF